ncbi:MAG: winged helix-turn-helix domain-containing protein, partial [Flavobacteriales bacterium]
ELIVRIQAILRRSSGLPQEGETIEEVELGAFTFDYNKQKLMLGEDETKLTTKENELLHLLTKHKNGVLERDYALREIWGDDNYFNGRSMDVYIAKLRKHLRKDEKIEIINVHGRGFKLLDA